MYETLTMLIKLSTSLEAGSFDSSSNEPKEQVGLTTAADFSTIVRDRLA